MVSKNSFGRTLAGNIRAERRFMCLALEMVVDFRSESITKPLRIVANSDAI